MMPSSSLACHDASFAAGLLEAATQALASENAVVLIAYDAPYPQPIQAVRPISAAFGVAMVLTGDQTNRSLAEIEIGISRKGKPITPVAIAALEPMRQSVPAARCLPLLAALAARTDGQVCLDYVAGNQLDVALRPC